MNCSFGRVKYLLVWANCHSPLRHALAKYSCVYMCEQMCHGCAVGAKSALAEYVRQFALILIRPISICSISICSISILSYFNFPFKYENAKIQKIMINVNND